MRTLVCATPGSLEYEERARPVLSAGRTILKIKRVGICGTDLHAYEGTQPFFNYPRVLGHELSGEIVDTDGAAGFEKGEVVSFIPYFHCGSCVACRAGKTNCCVTMNVCGVHSDGGMAEYLSVPSSSLLHSEGLSLDAMALVEPLAIGAHGVRRADVKPGEYVLVIGAGPIGLGTMEFARIAGGNVIATDIIDTRLKFCREKLKVSHVLNASSPALMEELRAITNGDMPTVVIDATGSLRAINNGFGYLAHGGRYVLIGLQRELISLSHPEFHKREATLMSSRNATRQDFLHVINSLKNDEVKPTIYITHRVKFDDIKANFKSWLDPANGVIKAIVEV